jgi:hypothetical protein
MDSITSKSNDENKESLSCVGTLITFQLSQTGHDNTSDFIRSILIQKKEVKVCKRQPQHKTIQVKAKQLSTLKDHSKEFEQFRVCATVIEERER